MKRILASGMAFVLFGGTPYAQTPQQISALRMEAKQLYRAGDYERAARMYKDLAREEPDNLEIQREAMWAQWNMGRYADAVAIAKIVKKAFPADSEAANILSWAPKIQKKDKDDQLHQRAITAYQEGHYTEAVQLYHALTQDQPENVTLLKELMWSLWNAERYDEAKKIAERIQTLKPETREAQEMLVRAPQAVKRQRLSQLNAQVGEYEQAGLWEQAVPLLQDMAALDAQNPAAQKRLARGHIRLGQFEDAKDAAFRVLSLTPRDAEGWSLLARAQLDQDQEDSALRSYQKSLQLNPQQPAVYLALGRLYNSRREFKTAVQYLQKAVESSSEQRVAYPLLGKAAFYTGDFAKAQWAWGRAAAAYPDQPDYPFHEAQARYYAGDVAGGIQKMQALATQFHNRQAAEFIIGDLVARGEVAEAERRIEELLKDMTPADETWMMKLADLYHENGQRDKLERLLDRFLQIWPEHIPALLYKGSLMYETERYKECEASFKHVLTLNPYAPTAYRSLMSCQEAQGRYADALHSLDLLQALDPTDPLTRLTKAETLYAMGRKNEARALLRRWLKANAGEIYVPAILYHGLTPFDQDPLLAYPYHHPVKVFEYHMKAIKEAGYEPVTAEDINAWLAHKKELPAKPIFIAFDDNRRDSFTYADPILEKYQLKATMFVAAVNTEGTHPPAYVSWDELRHYQSTGRWEMQAHGDIAHIDILIKAGGGRGLYLINREWQEKDATLEPMDAWKKRIEDDHRHVIEKLASQFGKAPSAYAFPQGLYGQQGNTNDKNAALLNLEAARRHFQTVYTQDDYGLIVRSKDPAHLTRLIPRNTWSGKDLIRHFTEKNPFVQYYSKLFEWAIWDGRIREANHWVGMLKDAGVSEAVVLARESEVRFTSGDLAAGQALLARSASMENRTEIQRMIDRYDKETGSGWVPSFSYHRDNSQRSYWEEELHVELPPTGPVRFRLLQIYGHYRQPGFASVSDKALGAGLDWKWGLFHTLSLEGEGHMLRPDATNVATGSGRLESRWSDGWRTTLEGGRSIYDTARALSANVHITYGQASTQWTDGRWDVRARGRWSGLSDDNRRVLAQGIVGKSLVDSGSLKLLYRFTYDDMRFENPDYYSPHRLKQHQLGPEWNWRRQRKLDLYLRYLAGYGKEELSDAQWTHEAEASLRYRFSEQTSISPSYRYERTPNYWNHIYAISLKLLF